MIYLIFRVCKMKLISWNVNGLRSILSKDKDGNKIIITGQPNVLESLVDEYDPDILCLQETRCPDTINVDLKYPHHRILASQTLKGYSGVAIYSKSKPIQIKKDFVENHEGRVLCFEYETFYVVNMYVPNSKANLSRLEYRIDMWEPSIRSYINLLQKHKPVILVGDMNVAPTIIDIYKTTGMKKSPGFTEAERTAFQKLTNECRIHDAYRIVHPFKIAYSWWSNIGQARTKNHGWRIDTVLVSESLANKICSVDILNMVYGSDHAPVYIELNC